ncbi:MAG: hypothetical protein GY850_29500 [bacterium]|nr:hypothetical protein [bacterium]
MSQKPEWEKFQLDTPATYRIRVQGSIDSAWSDMLDGMRISTGSTTGKETVTTLVGYLVDQAALSGVIKALYDLRIPLLSVENLDERGE